MLLLVFLCRGRLCHRVRPLYHILIEAEHLNPQSVVHIEESLLQRRDLIACEHLCRCDCIAQCAALEAQDGTLAATDSVTINGQSRAEWRYRRAVYCYTKAALLEHYADYDAAGKTAARADAKQEQAEQYRRDGHHAVADLLGRARIDCELV